MVSELSARLMRGHHSNNNVATTTLSQSPTVSSRNNYGAKTIYSDLSSRTTAVVSPTISAVSDIKPMKSISACTDKLHEISATSSRGKKVAGGSHSTEVDYHRVAGREGCFKRRKIDELHFAASCVKDDLEKGGLPFPALDTSLRHYIDLNSNEEATKGVRLVTSKSVSSSPFLTNIPNNTSRMATMADYGELFSATYDCYSQPANTGSATDSDWGSICSVTYEKTDGSSNSSFQILPRLEDALLNMQNNKISSGNKHVQKNTLKSSTTASTREGDAIYENPISIREAFDNSQEARLVTLSFAPFLVVHANPAYTSMTGLAPSEILGKPIDEIIQDQNCKAARKENSLARLHGLETSLVIGKKSSINTADDATDSGNNNYRILVAVVGSEKASKFDKSLMTHYMISLEEAPMAADAREEVETLESSTPFTSTTDAVIADNTISAGDTTDRPFVLPLPLLDTHNVALLPTMRLHCGVMG